MAGRYKAYPAYKDSGVEWLGEIPEGWQLLPCRSIVNNIVEKNDNAKDQNYLSLMANIGVIRYEDKGDVGNKKPDDLSKCKIVRKGNLVINSMNYAIGSYGMSEYDGVCSPVYIVLEPILSLVERRFVLRVFENKPFQKYLSIFGNGILEHRSAIGWDNIKGAYIPLPSKEAQQTIAQFLDYETAKINALIAKQEQLIELLKEKRQAVISHAVTKGLNPDAPMKDSGVEWLGQVPEHWKVVRLKHLLREPLLYGANESAESQNLEHPRFIRITDIDSNGLLRDETFRSLDPEIAKGYMLSDGDVLLARSGATVGKSFIYRGIWGDCCFAGYLIRASFDHKIIEPEFFYLITQSKFYHEWINSSLIQATIQNVSAEKYNNLHIALPSSKEINKILLFLKIKDKQFIELVNKATMAVNLLQERKTALISAAVTGKIDVRDWQPPSVG
ncbi:restriction endonuclease subunit S [Thiopseudomonas alkaliphila]|uniref:Restriction endonuclease subunit S n=1 Tax=Thiopseudomonas alkaliphila TaxID=1697053 RepID=A0AAW7DWR0_9GAMM|nr:restriction endonuclease subunit S [Thiopseudomonas alkaliphila]MDM1696837.1 restriction endonuclease subunit S [Thiopseudomonas alkaliphila]